MIHDTLQRMITAAIAALDERGDIEIPAEGIPPVVIERPAQANHGDYATTIALKLARPPKSREIATKIADYLNETVGLVPAYHLVEKVEVAGPGFINLRLRPEWLLSQAREIIQAGPHVGDLDLGHGEKYNLEFVSANPTGRVHIGNGRGGFTGDTLGNILRAVGYDVTKEYYFNDFGQQINKLGRSLVWYMRQELGETDIPKPTNAEGQVEGYFDSEHDPDDTYYRDVARKILAAGGAELLQLPPEARDETIGNRAAQYIMADIKATMIRLHIDFDVFFSQASLDRTGELQAGIDALRERGFLYDKDGAVFMETSQFGDDKDRVIIKSDGEPTYIASDVAYVRNKMQRGFAKLIYVLGADHHGYIGRLKATAQMFGYDKDSVHVLIYQNVGLKGARMSKRAGNVVTLDQLADLVGPDVMRFFYLMRAGDTHLDFDLDLAMKQSEENPGLNVQYGHARTAGVLRKATEAGFDPEAEARSADLATLANDPPEQLMAELNLMRELLRLEEVIEHAALTLEPHHLTKYGMDVAAAFHIFYDRCPILRADSEGQRAARFALTLAARTVLARVLSLLSMAAPDRMERAE